jgi:hypothetical protein
MGGKEVTNLVNSVISVYFVTIFLNDDPNITYWVFPAIVPSFTYM